ncbi:MAG: hypothetical protein H3C34_23565 [Caldilineaceae bacterium]|nr:hypothetical protein [Caldilineaceae bacterium]
MTAYGGVPAQYPTVVDPATGPQGPAHNNPLPFHLGKYVSREANADIGPDADATNNILPKPDVADRDRFDDGIAIGRLAFEHCRPATIPVQLFIAPGVSSLLEQGKGYLNVWVDGMRNGDWKDVAECAVDAGQTPELAFEHIIIDYPIDVTTLGPGLHVINVPAQNVLWPADKAEQPAWLRATLSERPANKPLTAGSVRYGDGRGYDDPFRLGETEDYLWRAAQDPKHGPDLFVHKQGVAKPAEIEPSGDGNPETGDGQGFDGIVWVIEYGNRGAATATNVRVVDDLSKAGDLSRLAIETRPELEVTRDGSRLIFKVGTLEPGQHGRIVIKVGLPANTASASFYNVAEIAGDYDINPENNRADATVKLELLAPIIVAPGNGTTCDGDLTVWGRAIPGSEIDVYVDDLMDGTTTTDSSGRWSYAMTLADGTHTIYAVARYGAFTSAPSRTVTVIVDSSLVWNPLSLRFTNELGWSHRPVDENGRTDESGWYVRLRPGMTYTVSVELCCSDPNASVQMVISDTETIDLTDDDSDGVYTGAFTAGDQPHTSGSIMIVAQCGSTEVTGSGTTLIDPEGVVYDVKSAAPLAASTVACMQAGTTGAGSGSATTYTLWPAADFGQVNPQSTGSDGYFSFFTPAGTYQLAVSRSGYQSYRSTDIQVVSDPVRYDVALTPQIDAAANHVVVITEYGFEPAYLAVRPGDVVEWVNMTADGHTATSYKTQAGAAAVGEANFDSGLLLAGEQYKFRFDSAASYTYVDAANPANSGTVVVAQDAGINTLFLPVVSR